MTEHESESVEHDEMEPSPVFGLFDVKCDEHFFYKITVDEERVFELPLVEISSLEVRRSFAASRYFGALISLLCGYFVFTQVGNEWVKWGIIVILALVFLGLITDPWDRFIRVESKNGAFDLDVEDSVNEKDVDAFVVAVQSRIKQRKKMME